MGVGPKIHHRSNGCSISKIYPELKTIIDVYETFASAAFSIFLNIWISNKLKTKELLALKIRTEVDIMLIIY